MTLVIWKKQSDGSWKVAVDADNPDPYSKREKRRSVFGA
jgi:ketosteroid isomerase-like protein